MNRGTSTSAASIAEADALARALYRRARLSGPDFADIATVVRGLHTVLKHLRVEAEDPDSLLNTSQQEHSVYARQLGPLVEDCDFTLKQLDTILEKYGGSSADTPSDEHPPGAPRPDGTCNGGHVIVGTMESREKDMIALIRTKLANQKTNIDIFLDTVQLHNPTKARQFVDNPQSSQLDAIKDKVDAIAARLAQRRNRSYMSSSNNSSFASSAGNGGGATSDREEEELWRQFCTELTKEGFSSDVLMRNKEVLRAYIRELDSNGLLDSDSPPSVRGLLDHRPAPGPPPRGPPMTVTPAWYAPPPLPAAASGDLSPKEVVSPANDNEKFLPSVKLDRRPPDYSSNVGHSQFHSHPNNHQSQNQSPPMQHQINSSNSNHNNIGSGNRNSNGQMQTYTPYRPPSLGLNIHSPTEAQHGENQLQTYNYPYAPPSPQHLQPPPLYNRSHSSASGYSDSDSDSDPAPRDLRLGLALISTRDLMQLDFREAERMASRMSGMHLSPGPYLPAPQYVSPGTSPSGPASGRYLPPPPTSASDHVLSSSPSQLAVSPRYVPPLPPPYTTQAGPNSPASMTVVTQPAPPSYGSSLASPTAANAMLPPHQQLPRLNSRLQPDSAGREIPLDAMWTKIRRSLVSPEVLSKAGVRYEARPDFVAVLGVLTRDQIVQFARLSDEARRQRTGGGKGYRPPPRYMRGGNGTGSPYRDAKRRSGSTTDSESEDLWDESDTSSDEERERARERRRYRRERERDSKDEKKREREKDDAKDAHNKDDDDEKGTKVYPFVLPLATAALAGDAAKNAEGKGTPASTVSPKSILKNKNENHVRFDDKDGPVEISPEEAAAEQRRRERRERERERDRDYDRERDYDRRRRGGDRESERGDRGRDRDRDRRERDRDRLSPRDRDYHGGRDHSDRRRSPRHHGHGNNGGSSRDRSSQRRDKKKAWGETLGAVGIGGAAASLLSVLSEAASGF